MSAAVSRKTLLHRSLASTSAAGQAVKGRGQCEGEGTVRRGEAARAKAAKMTGWGGGGARGCEMSECDAMGRRRNRGVSVESRPRINALSICSVGEKPKRRFLNSTAKDAATMTWRRLRAQSTNPHFRSLNHPEGGLKLAKLRSLRRRLWVLRASGNSVRRRRAT